MRFRTCSHVLGHPVYLQLLRNLYTQHNKWISSLITTASTFFLSTSKPLITPYTSFTLLIHTFHLTSCYAACFPDISAIIVWYATNNKFLLHIQCSSLSPFPRLVYVYQTFFNCICFFYSLVLSPTRRNLRASFGGQF